MIWYKRILVSSIMICFFMYFYMRETSIPIKRGLYYWELKNYLSQREIHVMDTHKINKLYIKLFDVGYDISLGIIPVTKTGFSSNSRDLNYKEVVPVIYIENQVFKSASKKELSEFADNTLFLINKMFAEKNLIELHEIQIDCDWTEKTQGNYFYYLKQLKKLTSKPISITLRLYAYKFPKAMGVPPADKAVLMCYNLLSPRNAKNRNSILDYDELEKYLVGSAPYPLPLDIALPTYEMVQLYHNHEFSGLFYPQSNDFINHFKTKKGLWYAIEKDTVIDETFFKSGDYFKYETISNALLKKSIALIKENVTFKNKPTLILFHLNELFTQKYTYDQVEAIYNQFPTN